MGGRRATRNERMRGAGWGCSSWSVVIGPLSFLHSFFIPYPSAPHANFINLRTSHSKHNNPHRTAIVHSLSQSGVGFEGSVTGRLWSRKVSTSGPTGEPPPGALSKLSY